MGEHTFGLIAQLVAATRAVNHVSIRLADMPAGYSSGLEYDPDHSTIMLDRSCDDRELMSELTHQVFELLQADRENTRLMLRSADELEDQGGRGGRACDREPLYRRQWPRGAGGPRQRGAPVPRPPGNQGAGPMDAP